jgi:MerR family transcriptional regulator, light-induced transcriptional regulator
LYHRCRLLKRKVNLGGADMNNRTRHFDGPGPASLTRARSLLEERGSNLPEAAVRALAREVIGRLDRFKPAGVVIGAAPTLDQITNLCDALLSSDNDAGHGLVMAARADGMTIETLHLAYIAEAARMLGTRWENDEASVSQVIIGAGRIYGILRTLREMFVSVRLQRPDRYRAAFASTPGEIHTLGVTMAADHLRRKGWQVDMKAGLTHDALIEQISRDDYPIIGLSASSSMMIFPLARLIVALRVTNPGAWIMIGGQIIKEEPHIQSLVDADGIVTDIESAEAQMEAHMSGAPEGQSEQQQG